MRDLAPEPAEGYQDKRNGCEHGKHVRDRLCQFYADHTDGRFEEEQDRHEVKAKTQHGQSGNGPKNTSAENEAVAAKYEVIWSSLFVNGWEDGKETVNNLTEFGFATAGKAPAAFREGLQSEIDRLLNML